MRFYNLHERLEILWKNVGLDLENQSDSMLEFLVNYPTPKRIEMVFDYILNNPPLGEVAEPLRLWNNYLVFKGNLSDTHNNFPNERMRENLLPILIFIILSENQLLLLNQYPDEIVKDPKYSPLDLERDLRRGIIVFEYRAAKYVEDKITKISLYNAYLRNRKYLKSKKDISLINGLFALCRVIIYSIDKNIPLSDKYLKDSLSEMGRIITRANKKKVGLDKDIAFALFKSLETINSPYAKEAYTLFKNIKYKMR